MTFSTKLWRKYIFVFLLPAVFFTGCGVWEDFTTYFNLYYNTSDTFEEAEKAIKEQERDLFSTEEIQVPTAANQALTKVVEKASKILQFHPNSAFVDDALMMLGKSFYYQKNYQKALRKFQELITAESESELSLETYLWIGKSQMRLKDYERGLGTLDAVLDTAISEGEDEIMKEAFVEEIVYHISNKNYSNAIAISKEFIEESGDDAVIAELYYEIGKLYVDMDDVENAIGAFREVNEYSPEYKVEVGANIELAKALRLTGKSEEALSILEEMGDEDKYTEDYDEIDLETGATLIVLRRFDEARELLAYADTSYQGSPFSGMARYKMGELYEYNFKNFDSASAYYLKSSTGSAPPEIIVSANAKNQKFKKYHTLAATLYENQNNLRYVLDPEAFAIDSARFVDSIEAEGGDLAAVEENQTQDFDQNELSQTVPSNVPTDETNGDQNQVNNPVQNTDDNSELNTNDEQSSNNNSRNNQNDRRLNRRPPTSNTQTQNVTQAIKPPARPTISADSINALLLKNKFEMGNLFLTEFNLIDSAFFYYSDVVQNYPKSQYTGRSLFGMGSYYEILGDTVKADSIYEVVYNNFRDEQVVNSAASKLNKPLIDLEYDPAKGMYAEAEKLLIEKNYRESLSKLNEIYVNYPQSDFAPKALYASGWILENELKMYDSAAAVYDSVAARYPATQYASTVLPKLTLYKSDQETRRKAIEDSLQALQAADSVAVDSLGNSVVAPIQTQISDEQINQPPGTPADSLLQEHEAVIDSLNREPGTQTEAPLTEPEPIDSLAPGKIDKIREE